MRSEKIIVFIILFILTLTTFVVATLYVLDKQFEKEWQNKCKRKSNTEARLTNSLKCLCAQLGIPLSYREELGDAAGQILYHSKNGRLILDNASIEILSTHENEPYVLAHELGHYLAIKQREDRSERGADAEAYRLCCTILTNKERELLNIALECYFHTS